MKVAELKAELKKRGMPVSGVKAVLVAWSKEAMLQGVPVAASVPMRHACMNNLDVTVFWEVLLPNPEPVPEPENENTTLHPPTKRDAPITLKHGYDEELE